MPGPVPRERCYWSWERCNELDLRELQALIIDYSSERVLLEREGDRWILPGYLKPWHQCPSSYLPASVKQALADCIGENIDVVLMRHLWREERDIERKVEDHTEQFTNEKTIVLMELYGEANRDIEKRGFFWVPLQEAEIYHLFPTAVKAIAAEISYVQSGKVPPNRVLWQRPGWYSQALEWVKNELNSQYGIQELRSVVPERCTPYSTILEVDTAIGRFFLKCAPMHENDAMCTEVLSCIVPQFVAKPIAVCAERGLLLTADYGEVLEPHRFDGDERVKLTHDYVELQRIASANLDILIGAGVKDLRPDSLMARLEELSSDPSFDDLGRIDGMESVLPCFAEVLDFLRDEIEELRLSGIPPSITRNDFFFDSDVYKPEGSKNYMFFDWGEAYIAHPLTGALAGSDDSEYLNEMSNHGSRDDSEGLEGTGRCVRTAIEFLRAFQEMTLMEEPQRSRDLRRAAGYLKSLKETTERARTEE